MICIFHLRLNKNIFVSFYFFLVEKESRFLCINCYYIGLFHPLFEAYSMLYLIFKVAAFLLKYSFSKERYVFYYLFILIIKIFFLITDFRNASYYDVSKFLFNIFRYGIMSLSNFPIFSCFVAFISICSIFIYA